MKIIEVIAPSNSSKTQSIVMAARRAHRLHPDTVTLVAKYYKRVMIDIIEVYQVKTSQGNKYVAYASQGDKVEWIEQNRNKHSMI